MKLVCVLYMPVTVCSLSPSPIQPASCPAYWELHYYHHPWQWLHCKVSISCLLLTVHLVQLNWYVFKFCRTSFRSLLFMKRQVEHLLANCRKPKVCSRCVIILNIYIYHLHCSRILEFIYFWWAWIFSHFAVKSRVIGCYSLPDSMHTSWINIMNDGKIDNYNSGW